MTDKRRELTHVDLLEASLRWALESYVRPTLDLAAATRRRPSHTLQREIWRLKQADSLLTEGGALGSQRLPGNGYE